MTSYLRWLVVTALTLLSVARADAATLTLSSASVSEPNSAAEVCVGLDLDADERVAGTENELRWDRGCASLLSGTCVANPRHGKSLSDALSITGSAFIYKALVLSFSDTDPIPAGELYCCDFAVHADPGGCCPITLAAAGASDPDGNPTAIAAGPPGPVCVAANAPTRIPTSTPLPAPDGTRTPITPGNRTRKPTATQSHPDRSEPYPGDLDDSCAIGADAPKRSGTTGLVAGLAVLAAVGWVRRRRTG